MRLWIQILRFGAILCLPAALALGHAARSGNLAGDYAVQQKYQECGQFRIQAIGANACDTPVPQSIYQQAQAGDRLHLGSLHVTLWRSDRFVAAAILQEGWVSLGWLLLALIPGLSFVPAGKFAEPRLALGVALAAELLVLGTWAASLVSPA